MASSNSIVEDYLQLLRRQFYRDEKTFFQQRQMLIKALTLAERLLKSSGKFVIVYRLVDLIASVRSLEGTRACMKIPLSK
jgi:hypothetical protein